MTHKKFVIIDAYNLIYRMFYAVPEMHTDDWVPVNAVYGVIKMLKSLHDEWWIDYLVIAADGPGKNFRAVHYEAYKWTRERMPDDLRVQIDIIFELIHLLQIPVLIEEWYEADDIIGSLVSGKFSQSEQNLDFIIISSDKDLCQFVGDRVMVYDAMKRIHIRKEWVYDKFWVPPEQIVDYLAICGDTSDNIPWIPGFWPKKAQSLLGTYGSLDNIYLHIDEITGKTRDTLIEFRDQAFLSQFLAKIYTQLDWESSLLENAVFPGESFWNQEIIERLQELKFNSLLPSDYQTSYKEISLLPIENVQTLESFQLFLGSIEGVPQGELFIDISSGNQLIQKVSIGYDGKIYTFHQTFWWDLFQVILSSKHLITWYDIKKDIFLMKQYLLLPQLSVPGNQNSLF